MKENQFNTDVTLFPNPAKEVITLKLISPKSERMQIEIFDVSGSLLMSESFVSKTGTVEKEINLEALNKGLYFVKVTSKNQSVSKKFIKQ